MRFLTQSFWTTLSSVAFAAYGFITNKLFALYFGPQGVTLLAHFQNLVAIIVTLPNEGINRGLIKFLADTSLKLAEKKKYVSTAIVWNLLSLAATLTGIALLSTFYKNDFPSDLFTINNILLIITGIVLQLATLFMVSVLMARQQIRLFSWFSIFNNVAGLLFVYWALNKNITYSLVALAFAQSGAFLLLLVYFFIQKNEKCTWDVFWPIPKIYFANIGQFVITAISSVILSRLVDFFVRSYLISTFDFHTTGLWQSVVKISDGYSSLFSAALGVLIFTKISAAAGQKQQLMQTIWKSIRFTATATGAGLILIYLLKELALELLYSKQFTEAAYLMPFQLLGDWLKFPAWILGFSLQIQMRTRIFIATQMASHIFYLLLLYLILPVYGIEALPIAHFVRFIFYLGLLISVNKSVLWAK